MMHPPFGASSFPDTGQSFWETGHGQGTGVATAPSHRLGVVAHQQGMFSVWKSVTVRVLADSV